MEAFSTAAILFPTMSFLRFLMLLALIVWIGGIIFFAFVLAPTLFGVLPTTKLAGDVVNATLTKLHWMGLISGVVFLICSLLYNWQKHVQLRPFVLEPCFCCADAGFHDGFAIRDHADGCVSCGRAP